MANFGGFHWSPCRKAEEASGVMQATLSVPVLRIANRQKNSVSMPSRRLSALSDGKEAERTLRNVKHRLYAMRTSRDVLRGKNVLEHYHLSIILRPHSVKIPEVQNHFSVAVGCLGQCLERIGGT